jgi:hypothetical protein
MHMHVIMHMMELCTNIFGDDQVCHSNHIEMKDQHEN